jgi:hypothetical protein
MNISPEKREEAIKVAIETAQSQGARHPRAKIEALVDSLLAGEQPQSYGERFIQIGLQAKGFLPRQ